MALTLGSVEARAGQEPAQLFLHAGNRQAFAGRSALMQAEIAVGEELVFVLEDADFLLPDTDDLAISVLEFRGFTNKLLCHGSFLSLMMRRFLVWNRPVATGRGGCFCPGSNSTEN
mgnify:CR=1 FL=1